MDGMRTRKMSTKRDTFVIVNASTETGLPKSPPYNGDAFYASAYEGSENSMSDVSHPGFRRQARQGNLVMGPMFLSKTSRSYGSGSCSGYVPIYKETWNHHGDLIGHCRSATSLNPHIGADISRLTQIAIVKAYAKMKQSSVMGGEIVSDLAHTVSMFRRPFGNSVKLLKSMIKKRDKLLSRGYTLARASSNAWLEYRYGWQPIALDIDTLVKEGMRYSSNLNRRLVVRAGSANLGKFTSEFADRAGDAGWSPPLLFTGRASSSFDLASSCGIFFDVLNKSEADKIAKIIGSRSPDLLPTVWEKIPYSFVVDWFVNVGDWIQAIVPDPFTNVVSSWVTEVSKIEYIIEASKVTRTLGGTTLTGSGGSSTETIVTVSRTIDPQLPTTPIMLQKPLSMIHSADAASLLLRPVHDLLKQLRH